MDATDDLGDVEHLLEPACYGDGFLCCGHCDDVLDDRRHHPLAEHVGELFHSGLVHSELVCHNPVLSTTG